MPDAAFVCGADASKVTGTGIMSQNPIVPQTMDNNNNIWQCISPRDKIRERENINNNNNNIIILITIIIIIIIIIYNHYTTLFSCHIAPHWSKDRRPNLRQTYFLRFLSPPLIDCKSKFDLGYRLCPLHLLLPLHRISTTTTHYSFYISIWRP